MFFREALRRCFFKKTLQIFLYIHKIPFLVILRLSFTFCILLTLFFIFHFPFIKIIFFCFYFCSWGPRLNRHLNDWEVGEVESFLGKLFPMTIRRGVDDLLRWKENKNGTFSVKSFYSSLSRGIKPPFPTRTIWTPWVPIRASFFGWEATWSRLLTIDRLEEI